MLRFSEGADTGALFFARTTPRLDAGLLPELPDTVAPRLVEGLAALRVAPGLAGPLLAYLALILQWNRAYNLTAVRDPDAMVALHLLDSLSIVPMLEALVRRSADERRFRLIDIGSGAGLPGIPLALALPQIDVAMVESVGKKARFLREAVRRLGLGERVRVLECRAEALDEPAAHDCLVARALGNLAMLLATGGHLVRPGGRLLAMKGQVPQQEIAALPPGWSLGAVVPLTVPGLDAERHLVVVDKTAA